MSKSKIDESLTKLLLICVAVIIVVVPFYAILTVWPAELVGHYTLLRLWDEILLAVLALGALYLFIRNRRTRAQLTHSKLAWLIVAYFAVQIAWGVVAYLTHHVSAKALGYGWVSDCRYLVFFLAVWIIAAETPKLKKLWPPLIFWPAVVVVIFGLLQYFVLPYDFLSHLGYNAATIYPYEDINHNVHYIRVMSSLRGANPLGAYLVVVLSLLAAVLLKRRQWRYATLGIGGLIVMGLSFSRSAWIGLGLSLATLLWLSLKARRSKQLVALGALICVIIVGAAAFALRGNTTFQNTFFHTQANSAIKATSDEGHASALSSGLHDLAHEPLGRGPGTAGPASVYNTGHPGRIAENYFVQIGQETGWLGLALFLIINLLVAKELWQRRNQTLALGLLAALVGVSLVNMLSHAWSDDTLAFLWWGLAGLALAMSAKLSKTETTDA